MASWDVLQEPWDAIGTWALGGAGTSEISPAGQLRNLPNAGTHVYRGKDIGVLPEAGYTVEFRALVDSWGTGDGFYHYQFYDGLHRIWFQIYADRIRNADSGSVVYVATSAGVWYVWRLVIDSDGHRLKVYRDEEYLGDLGGGLNYTANDGVIYAADTENPSGKSGAESHTDYLNIATGLIIPLTVSEVLGMSDSVARRADFKQAVSEVLGMSDAATRALTARVTASEILGMRDGVEARKHVGRLGDLPDHYREGGA